eukprot:4364655-Pyramimonas_sp.AAC.1
MRQSCVLELCSRCRHGPAQHALRVALVLRVVVRCAHGRGQGVLAHGDDPVEAAARAPHEERALELLGDR